MDELTKEKLEADKIEALQHEEYIKSQIAKGLTQCSMCGEWVDDTYGGYCDNCIDEVVHDTNVEEVMQYAKESGDEFELLTEWLFTKEQTITIMKQAVKEALKLDKSIFDEDIKEFIEEDILDFFDYKRRKNNGVEI